MGQEFPKMIYHIMLRQNKIVNDAIEQDEWIKQGWTTDYSKYANTISAEEKIAWHKSEIERLEKTLHNYDYETKLKDVEKEIEKLDEAQKETEKTIEAQDEPKKRGRPKKEV